MIRRQTSCSCVPVQVGGKLVALSAEVGQGEKPPFQFEVTPHRKDDQIVLEVAAKLRGSWPDKQSEKSIRLRLTTLPDHTSVIPLPIWHSEQRASALFIRPQIVAATSAARFNQPKSAATLQMVIVEANSDSVRKLLNETATIQAKLTNIKIRRRKKSDSFVRQAYLRNFRMDQATAKTLLTKLRLADTSSKIVSRPQIRTLMGHKARLEVSAGVPKSPDSAAGLRVSVTPWKIGQRTLLLDTNLEIDQLKESVTPADQALGFSLDVESTLTVAPQQTAGMVIGGKDMERSYILLTDLAGIDAFIATSERPRLATAFRPPQTPAHAIRTRATQALPRPSKPTNMRVVTVQAITVAAVSAGDTVDVLLVHSENGDADKAKISTLAESVQVYQSAAASFDQTTAVSLLVEKKQVEELLLAQLKGNLRLSLHRADITSRQPRVLRYPAALPPRPYVSHTVDNQPSSVKSQLTSTPRDKQPKTDVQQVWDEVRAMRKLLQGLKNDIDRLRRSAEAIKSSASGQEAVDPLEPRQRPRRSQRVLSQNQELAEQVAKALKEANMQGFDLTIEVDDGACTLTGFIKDDGQIKRAIQCATQVPGITRVVNRLRVSGFKKRPAQVAFRYQQPTSTPSLEWELVQPHTTKWVTQPIPRTRSATLQNNSSKIEQALNQKVSLESADKSLRETLQHLAKTAGINTVLDQQGLEEEGLTADQKIAIHLSDVTLRSTLNLLLKPLNLGYTIEDDVLKITSKNRLKGKMIIATYSVAGLIGNDAPNTKSYDDLASLITSIIEPDAWSEVGGPGVIQSNAANHALVIRQTQSVHQQVRELLAVLNKWQTKQDQADVDRIDLGKLEKKLNALFPNSHIYLVPGSRKVIVLGQVHDSEEEIKILTIIQGELENRSGANKQQITIQPKFEIAIGKKAANQRKAAEPQGDAAASNPIKPVPKKR